MKIFKLLALTALLALLLVPVAVYAQEQAAPEHGVIEFGFRAVTGEVFGRTQTGTLPFSNGFRPDLLNSRLNIYSDYRNAFYIPKLDTRIENLFGSQNYLRLQSASNGFAFQGGGSLSRDQSVLVSLGQYGHYKVQFRFEETPHIFSGTTRTLFTNGGRGIWTVDPALQARLFSTICGGIRTTGTATQIGTCSTTYNLGTAANAISNAVAGNLVAGVPGAQLFTQQESRKAIAGSLGFNITPDVNVTALFSRENQVGTRPIGFVMGNGSTGYAVEAPESIDYYTNTIKVTTEFGRKRWDASLGYQGSFFQNNTPSMVVSNPFSNVYDAGVTATNTRGNATGMGPATGRMDLYPDNRYQQFVGQGAIGLGKHVNLMANVTPGFLRQNAAFQPLTTNTALNLTPPAGYPAFVPSPSLNGQVDTLAMNYTAVLKATKTFKIVSKYQHYKYDDNTPNMLVRPVIADTAWMSFREAPGVWVDPVIGPSSSLAVIPGATYYLDAEHSSFTNRLFDLGGTWFFAKKKSVKFGYQRGWTDRTHREVAETIEDSFYGALDMQLRKNVLLRVSGRHQNRTPQEYEFDRANYYSRMPDQSTRLRDRGDVSLTWDATQKLSLSAFWGTLQDDFNQRGGVNSLVPLGDASTSPVRIAGTKPTPIYGPYYAYGVLNTIGRNYGVSANYALTPKLALVAEYTREKNTGVLVQGKALNPGSPCVPTGAGFTIPVGTRYANGALSYSNNPVKDCDPINDLLTASKDLVNSYYGGVDVTSKKLDLSLYYSLAAGQSFAYSNGVNCQITDGVPGSYCFDHFANWKLDNLAADQPLASTVWYQAVSFGAPQNVNRTHELGAVARFKLTDKLIPKFQYIFRQNDYNDWQTQVNPYSFTGLPFSFAGTLTDPAGVTALQKMLLLGADQPSFRAHIVSVTLEYHF